MNKRWAILTGVVVALVALYVGGNQVPGCLGPIGVTVAQCAAGMAESGQLWAPGPGAGSAVLIGLPFAVFIATLFPWRRLDRRELMVSGGGAFVAGVIGAIYYDMTRPMSITQTNEWSGMTHTAPLAANADVRILTSLFAASVVGVAAAWLLALMHSRSSRQQ
jgi:hypothetical protein